MFFARIWGVFLICYINQGNLIMKLGCPCQIPRRKKSENWPRSSNNTVLYFHFSQIHFSSGAHLSFSHPLFREMSSFLPLPAPSLIPPSECHQTIRPIIPKTLMETMTRTKKITKTMTNILTKTTTETMTKTMVETKTATKTMTCHLPNQYHSQSVTIYPITSDPSGFTAHI